MTDSEGIWAAKSDDELLEAADEISEYTEEGERNIRAELQRRGLPQPDPPIGACSRCGRSIARTYSGDRCSQCGAALPPEILRALSVAGPEAVLVPVLRTSDRGLILAARSLLEEERIDYFVRGEDAQDPFGGAPLGGYPFTGIPEFLVRTEDAERARALLDELTELPPEAGDESTTTTEH